MDFGTALFLVVVLENIIIDLNMQMIHEKHNKILDTAQLMNKRYTKIP